MSRSTRLLSRAIWVTPRADRDRYAREWRGDLASAAELGISPVDVARGAGRVAWRLRLQWWGRTLAGAEGKGRATAAWTLVASALPVLLLVGGPLLPLIIPAAMAVALLLTHRGNSDRGDTDRGHSRVGSVVMLGAGVLWLVCTVVFWWLWGVAFDAADTFQPSPAVVRWSGPSFLVGLGAFVTFWIAFAVSVIQRSTEKAGGQQS